MCVYPIKTHHLRGTGLTSGPYYSGKAYSLEKSLTDLTTDQVPVDELIMQPTSPCVQHKLPS